MHKHTHLSCWIKTPVIQNTQTGWQAATCVSQVLSVFSSRLQWAGKTSRQTEMSCVFVSSRQAGRGRRAREGEEGNRERWRRWEKRERERKTKQRGNERGRGGRANLHTLQTKANHWFICLDRYFSTQTLLTGTSIGGCLFLLLLCSIFFLSFSFSSKAAKTESFSLGRGKE